VTRPVRRRSRASFKLRRRRCAAAAGGFVAATTALLLPIARATAATETVSVSIAPCDASGVIAERLTELISTELTASGAELTAMPTPDALRASIVLCDGSPEHVGLVLSDGGRAVQRRDVDLSDVAGELRARTVAVALAEMLSARRAHEARTALETTTTAAAVEPRDVVSVAPSTSTGGLAAPLSPARAHAPRHGTPPRYSIGAGLQVREFAQPRTALVGPWLSIAAGPWRLEALYGQARVGVPLGTVWLRSAGLGASWTPWRLGRTLHVELGIRGELGVAWASGSASDDGRAIGVTLAREQAALMAESRFEIPWRSRVGLQMSLTAGYAHGPTALADRAEVATCGGPFAGAALGVRAHL